MNYKNFFIYAVFREDKKHSNYVDTVIQMVKHILKKIRKGCREDVPILIRTDAGFFYQKNFKALEALRVG